MQDVREDAFQLAAQIMSRFPRLADDVKCRIAMERGEEEENIWFLYNLPETPYFFIHKELFSIIDSLPGELLRPHRRKGQMEVKIILVKLRDWFEEELKKKLDNKMVYDASNDIWKEDFKFVDGNTLVLSPFGKLSFSDKNGLSKSKINQRALLLKIIADGKAEGVTANKIRKEFLEHKIAINNDRIEANIKQINDRLEKAFKNSGVVVSIKNIGSKGVKMLKLSVQIPQKT